MKRTDPEIRTSELSPLRGSDYPAGRVIPTSIRTAVESISVFLPITYSGSSDGFRAASQPIPNPHSVPLNPNLALAAICGFATAPQHEGNGDG